MGRRIELGRWRGLQVRLDLGRPRRSTEAPVDAGRLLVGRAVIDLDPGRMPARLERLVPHGYANAPLAAWEPFLAEAEWAWPGGFREHRRKTKKATRPRTV